MLRSHQSPKPYRKGQAVFMLLVMLRKECSFTWGQKTLCSQVSWGVCSPSSVPGNLALSASAPSHPLWLPPGAFRLPLLSDTCSHLHACLRVQLALWVTSLGFSPGRQCFCCPKISVPYTTSFMFSVSILPSPSLPNSEFTHSFWQAHVHTHTHTNNSEKKLADMRNYWFTYSV